MASHAGLGPKNDYAGEDQQQLETGGPFSRQKERSILTNSQLSDSNKKVVVRLTPRQTGRLTVRRNITLTLTC
jgi:hypothetical protein